MQGDIPICSRTSNSCGLPAEKTLKFYCICSTPLQVSRRGTRPATVPGTLLVFHDEVAYTVHTDCAEAESQSGTELTARSINPNSNPICHSWKISGAFGSPGRHGNIHVHEMRYRKQNMQGMGKLPQGNIEAASLSIPKVWKVIFKTVGLP